MWVRWFVTPLCSSEGHKKRRTLEKLSMLLRKISISTKNLFIPLKTEHPLEMCLINFMALNKLNFFKMCTTTKSNKKKCSQIEIKIRKKKFIYTRANNRSNWVETNWNELYWAVTYRMRTVCSAEMVIMARQNRIW